jgi:hypothetical protein
LDEFTAKPTQPASPTRSLPAQIAFPTVNDLYHSGDLPSPFLKNAK